MIETTLLGTGCPIPTPSRAGPATLVRAAGRTVLVDCGRGVLMRLAAAGSSPTALDLVVLTHLHSDHVQDLSDVITMRWAMSLADNPLNVIGPPGTDDFVRRTIAMMSDDIAFRILHHADLTAPPHVDVTEVADGLAHEDGALRITSALVDHGVVKPALGFRFDAGGASVAISGDTLPCAGLDRLAAGAGVLVQSVVRPATVGRIPSPRFKDVLDYHSSTEDAGRTAARAGVGTLLLTHYVPSPPPGTEDEWAAEARKHFRGTVVPGVDLTSITA